MWLSNEGRASLMIDWWTYTPQIPNLQATP